MNPAFLMGVWAGSGWAIGSSRGSRSSGWRFLRGLEGLNLTLNEEVKKEAPVSGSGARTGMTWALVSPTDSSFSAASCSCDFAPNEP